MQAWVMGLFVSGLVAAQTPPVEVLAKDLPVVNGPMPSERLRDMAGGPGTSRIEMKIRHSARRSPYLPGVAVPVGEAVAVSHTMANPAGWQSFRVEAGPGEKLKARLRGDHEAWFVVRCVNRNGQLEPGMLQNLIHTGNPEATYVNPGTTPVTVYFVVDTRDVLSGTEPYVITFTREKAGAEPGK